ncbi:MAG: hypothetical protein QOK40_3510 [Miltoncostaeaceae bacterium]|jgi:uncharacterized protein YqhQ|nr:hypothetical protein [Miltoncostaeaceae bacterium]
MPDQEPRNRLGGMALANGLLVHGPVHWAAAVRDRDGTVLVASGRKPRLAAGPFRALADAPLVRGLIRLGEAMAVVPVARRGLPQARLAVEDRAVGATVVASLIVAAISRRRVGSVLAQEAIGALSSLAPALVAVRRSEAAIWHGVEHKSIAAYEAGGADGLAHAADQAKEHDRCGSNLILPLLVTTTLANAAARAVGGRRRMLTRSGAAAVAVGAAFEIFAFSARRPRHPVSRTIHAVGHALQSGFSTREPGERDLSVGRAAMDELLRAEARPDRG